MLPLDRTITGENKACKSASNESFCIARKETGRRNYAKAIALRAPVGSCSSIDNDYFRVRQHERWRLNTDAHYQYWWYHAELLTSRSNL